MQRAFQGTDGGRDGRVHVAERSCDHASREGGGIQFVVGVQDESDIQRSLRRSTRNLAIQLVQKVSGMRKAAVRLDDMLPFANAVVGGDDVGDLRGQANGLANIGLGVVYLLFRVVERECGNDSA